ncbi:hypothetical protein [Streptomyces chartreusis]
MAQDRRLTDASGWTSYDLAQDAQGAIWAQEGRAAAGEPWTGTPRG